MESASEATRLRDWYRREQRDLPWRHRSDPDPYKVWISEVMLQQTTSTAVIPYYKRFIERFPDLQSLAAATLEDVYAMWVGLGYYSRARLLHKTAKQLYAQGGEWPQSYKDLLLLPGLGPYTARAIASIAFGEAVGVVDGNVIRVYSRMRNEPIQWWQMRERERIQTWADAMAKLSPSEVNQALMDLGATICTARSPQCFLCPVRASCGSFKAGTQSGLPLPKPRRPRENWIWTVLFCVRNGKMALVEEHSLPFLRQTLVPPGSAQCRKMRPKRFDIRHSVTHHDIFISIKTVSPSELTARGIQWVAIKDLPKKAPSSLLQKIMAHTHTLLQGEGHQSERRAD